MIKNYLLKIIGTFTFILSFLFPKSKKVWVFGSWAGEKYADNSKYLFEYVNINHRDITAVWLSHNISVIDYLIKKGYRAYKINSLSGLYFSFRAKMGFVTHGLIDLNMFATGRMKIVQLWHGIPLKPILYSDPKEETIKALSSKKAVSFIFPYYYKDINFKKCILITSSSYTKNIFKTVFDSDNIQITGYPRNDGLFDENEKCLPYEGNSNSRKGIYLPTYRKQNEFDILKLFQDSFSMIDNFLKEENIILYVKLHPFHLNKLKVPNKDCNIKLLRDEDINGDIYSVLNEFDFLITDYSSILFDYLILNRPILLAPFDLNNYIKDNGSFLMNYDELPFDNHFSWSDVIKDLKAHEERNYEISEEQKLFSKKINKYNDAENSKRVFELVKKEINL